jgi:hypothetical protein
MWGELSADKTYTWNPSGGIYAYSFLKEGPFINLISEPDSPTAAYGASSWNWGLLHKEHLVIECGYTDDTDRIYESGVFGAIQVYGNMGWVIITTPSLPDRNVTTFEGVITKKIIWIRTR